MSRDADCLQQYKQKAEEFEIPIDKRLYCGVPDCGEFIRKVDRANQTARCTKGHVMCIFCRDTPHPRDQACPEDNDRRLADQLARDEGWRRCISCKILVEHREACQHMTCRCGAQFCYVCGARWRTCACTMEQLQQLKATATSRRAEREKQEHADEAWLQEALEAIEAAQREEEEAWRAELARRHQAKYEALRGALLKLNDLQEVTMLEVHTTESLEDGRKAISRRAEVASKHETERKELRITTLAKITAAELEWQSDLRSRALWSR